MQSSSGCRAGLALLALLWAIPGPVAAQTAALGGASTAEASQEIDPEQALESARASFREAAAERLDTLLDERGEGDEEASAFRGELRTAEQDFEKAARAELTKLRGDGALTFDEVTRTLASTREDGLDRLEDQLRAQLEGVPPPPGLREDAAEQQFADLARYTVWVRNSPLRWLSFVASILGGLFLAALLSFGARRLARGRSNAIAAALEAADGALYATASLLGVAVGLEWIWLPAAVSGAIAATIRLCFSLVLLWLAWMLCDVIAQAIGWIARRTRSPIAEDRLDLVRKGLRLGAVSVFALVSAELVFDTDIRAVLAGLGILTLGVSLAAQDTLKNLIGSLTVYGDRPFQQGDLIRYRKIVGNVERVGFRSTRLRRLTGELVTVPNADVVKEPVENLSARGWFRTRIRLDVLYGIEPDRLDSILEELRSLLADRSDQPEARPCEVLVEELGSHSIRILVEFAHSSGDYWEGLHESSDVKRAIHRLFADEGVAFAFPTATIELEPALPGDVDDQGEVV